MRVTELWRYPVKSMGGETLLSADVDELGIAGDRGWGLFDLGTGTTLTARRTPELLFASARIAGGELRIELPTGETVGEDDGAALSSWLGREVEVRSAGDDLETGGTYEAPRDAERDRQWVSWTGPGGAFHDSARARLSLVSETTLGDWDRRRFRANVIVSGDGEDAWVGSDIEVGDVRLSVVKQIDRCVMVTRPQPGLERDLDVLRAINAERATFLAIGCTVARPGSVTMGAAVRPAR